MHTPTIEMVRSGGVAPQRARADIEGLRAVAAISVAVYHIWFDRISGGVDVFLVVSGYLMFGSVLRQTVAGSFDLRGYLLRIARRIIPLALLVVAVLALLTPVVFSPVRWADVYADLFASLGYFSNWHFANQAIDYNAVDLDSSPALHFWALSVQAQFYVVLPLLVGVSAWAGARVKLPPRPALGVGLSLVVALSFLRATSGVSSNQPFAYFDTFARLWEFALGGLLAVVGSSLMLPRTLRWILGVMGLAAVLAGPVFFDLGPGSPGVVTLLPVLGAAAILVSGVGRPEESPSLAQRLLGIRPLVALGAISYAFYIWHWPVLVVVREVGDMAEVGFTIGLAVIGFSTLLAFVSHRLIERPIGRYRERTHRSRRPALSEVGVVAVVVSIVVVMPMLVIEPLVPAPPATGGEQLQHPGAMALHEGFVEPAEYTEPVIPALASARRDREAVRRNQCMVTTSTPQSDELRTCILGVEDGATTVVLVGASHVAHWIAGLEVAALELDLELITMLRTGCRFELPPRSGTGDDCVRWLDLVVESLTELRPDFVLTTATVTTRSSEDVPPGYLGAWQVLDDLGIEVIGIRDTPRFEFDVPTCVADHGPNSPECRSPRPDQEMGREWFDLLHERPPNTTLIDLRDHICGSEFCDPVVGNVLVFRDSSHLSDSYSRTLASALVEVLEEAGVGGLAER